ncbi:MAG TPA: DUF4184 family protein [Nitrososphaera sp.]|nr:DUF4184 family protein [Nitrososphaera sp.]
MEKANKRQNKFMTLTPLHVAFVWVLKLRFKKLHFAALTVGALIPDIEPLIAGMFGWSVFRGLDFPCSRSPDRLVLHSIMVAITIDVALTIIFVKIIGKPGAEKLGIQGFTNVKANAALFGSAAIGSLSHVLVDWLRHPAKPGFLAVFGRWLVLCKWTAACIYGSFACLHHCGNYSIYDYDCIHSKRSQQKRL